jgi:hypothetical protein
LQKAYTRTVALKAADPAICALHKIGLAYDQFADQLINFPVPKGMTEDLRLEVQPQFQQQAQKYIQNATEAFRAVVQKSQELDVFNPCTRAALEMLRTKYAPEQFPKMPEDTFALKVDAQRQPATGGDLLSSIQPVPTAGAERARDLRAKAAEVEATDLASRGPEVDHPSAPEPSPPPKVAPAPSPPPKGAPAPAPAGEGSTTTKSKQSPDDEPEDVL